MMLSDAHENWLKLYFNIKLSTRPFKMMQTDATSGQKTEKLHFLLMKCHMLSCQWNQTLEQVKINETHFWIYFAFCCRGFLLRSRYNSPWGINSWRSFRKFIFSTNKLNKLLSTQMLPKLCGWFLQFCPLHVDGVLDWWI